MTYKKEWEMLFSFCFLCSLSFYKIPKEKLSFFKNLKNLVGKNETKKITKYYFKKNP